MRRALTAVLSIVLTTGLGLVSLATAPAASAAPKVESTRTVEAPVDIWKASAAQTPGGRLDYCAVTVFVVFGDLKGYLPSGVDYTYTSGGVTSDYSQPLAAPYDDVFTWGPLGRSAPDGKHQSVLGGQPFVWSAGSPDCEAAYAKAVAGFPMTATVTYRATDRCQRAIDRYLAAHKAVKRGKRAVANATTPPRKAAAVRKLRAAKAKLAKARKNHKRRC